MANHGYADDVTIFYCECGEQFDQFADFETHLDDYTEGND